VGGRQLRGGGSGGELTPNGEPAVARLGAAMRKAEAAVLAQEGMEVGLLVKELFGGPVEEVLQRMAGSGGRRPAAAEARGAASEAGAGGGRGGRWAGAAAAADAVGGGEGGGGGGAGY
jgi:hypothetical protein